MKNIFPLLSIEAKLIELGGEKNIETGLQNALATNDSVGGIVECVAQPLPVGLGEPFLILWRL